MPASTSARLGSSSTTRTRTGRPVGTARQWVARRRPGALIATSMPAWSRWQSSESPLNRLCICPGHRSAERPHSENRRNTQDGSDRHSARWTAIRRRRRRTPAPARARRHRARSGVPRCGAAAIGAGALAVLALWWHDTPVVSGLGDWLTNAGRITGLLAGYAVVVLLALMARVPALERGVGTDRLARWHAMGGRYTVSLAVAHTLLIIWGYAVTAHTGVVHQTATLLLTYPDVLMATVAALLLVGVGVVSARAARRRLRYETWYYLHFYTYLAIALAFSHQFATGADFMAQPAGARRSGRCCTSASRPAGVVPVRHPDRAALPAPAARRRGVRREPRVVSVYVTRPAPGRAGRRAGPVLPLAVPDPRPVVGGQPVLAVGAARRPDLLRITVKVAGDHSAALARAAARHPGPRRGTVRLVHRGAAAPAARSCSSRAGSASPRCGRCSRRCPAHPGDVTLIYRASSAR